MSDSDITYDMSLLEQSNQAWRVSSGLRSVYEDLYCSIEAASVGGCILEIGAGIGVSSEYMEGVTTTDLVKTPFVDCAMSAYEIKQPSCADAWTTIFALDTLHHLREPLRFLESASGQLESGGRIVLMEPAGTMFGCLFYTLFHHEPIQPKLVNPPFQFEANGEGDEFANMGMGVGMFVRHRKHIDARLQAIGLRVKAITFRDILAYPLTGGYSGGQKAPTFVIRGILRLEKCLPQWLLRCLGVRMCIVLEKYANE